MNVFVEFALTILIAILVALIGRAVWSRWHSRPLSLSLRAADWIFFALALAYVLVFGGLSLLRHESFHSGGYDLGIFDQVIWNSLHGRLFENSIMIDSPSFLGHHFSPLLLALVPLYAIWSDARVLLIVQTLALALGGLPIYWFARKRLGAGLALALVAAYFLYPSLQFVNLFEFHEIALATPLLAFAIYFLLDRNYRPFLVCLFLALLLKEEITFIAVGFGLYILIVQRQRALGLALAVFGAVWAVAVLQLVIPFFYGTAYGTKYYFVERYLYLGDNVPDIVKTAIMQPGLVLQHLIVPVKIEFVLQLLVPLAFIPLAGFEVLALTIPSLGYILVGDNAFQNSIHFQYTAPLIPFVFFATVVGLKRLQAQTRTLALALLLIVGGLGNYYFQSAGPLAQGFDPKVYALTSHVQLGYQILSQIPPDATLMAESNFVPHLSERRYAYQASVVPNLRAIDYLLIDTTLPIHGEYEMIWQDIMPSPFYETLIARDGYILKRRAQISVSHPVNLQFGEGITLLGYTLETRTPVRCGETAALILAWRADQPIRERYVAFVHLVGAQEQIVAQDDREPANGWFRTDWWQTGDITNDRFTLELPSDLPPGEYRLTTGFYRVSDQSNISARDQKGTDLGVAPVIGTLTVTK